MLGHPNIGAGRAASRRGSERRNILISGGTGTGKTTLLNALAATIPDADRIVLIEETSKIMIEKPNLVRFESTARADAPRPGGALAGRQHRGPAPRDAAP